MFGLDYGEILVIAIVALVVIGPKDLPRVLRQVGQWVGKGRAMARHFRTGMDAMIREAELEEMNKQWAKQNAEIMAQTAPHYPDPEAIADHSHAEQGGAASPEERAALFGESPAAAEPVPYIPAPHLAAPAEPAAVEPAPKPKRQRKPKPPAPEMPAA